MTTFNIINETIHDLCSLNIPLDVINISLRSCRIRHIPYDFFAKFNKLESIDLFDNYIDNLNFIIPHKVTYIDLSYNKLHDNAFVNFDPNNIEYMVLRYNMLTCVPESIKNIECEIHGNNINIIKNIVKNIVNDVKKINLDVHQTYIQKSLRKSIMYLMSTYKTHPYNNNYLYDIKMYISGNVFNYYINTIFKNTKKGYFFKLLDIYDSLPSDIIYDFNRDLKCKINNLLERIWELSKHKKEIESIIENLYAQLSDGINTCFVGKYTRVINTLSTFDDNIEQDIPFSEKFIMKLNQLKDIIDKKKEMIDFINDSNLDNDEKLVWIDAVDEYI